MDRIEQTVRRRSERDIAKDKLKYRICLILAIAFFSYGLVALCVTFTQISSSGNFSLARFLPVIITAGVGVICFLKKDGFLKEYDYTVEDDVFTVAKILNLEKRKEVFSMNVRGFKRVESYSKERISSLNVKTLDFSLNGTEEKCILFVNDGSEEKALILEPNEKFYSEIQKEIKRK